MGDIHGRLELLDKLLARLDLDQERDELVFLGDYIDRGPDSKGVIERLMLLEKEPLGTVFLRGNHEAMLLDYLAGKRKDLFLFNGGIATLRSYARPGQDLEEVAPPPAHLDFIRRLKLYYQSGETIFVHAGLRPGIPLEEQDPHDLIWIREEFHSSGYDWGKTIVFGHTPFGEPFVRGRLIGLDTGAGYDGRLTCLVLPEREFIQV